MTRLVVPDAIHHADTSESLEYIKGWNDCRQAMLEQPEHQDMIGEAQDKLIAEQAAQAQPAQKRPQNCGTGYCSCIECVMEPSQQEPVGIVKDLFTNAAWDKLDVVGSTKVYLDFPPAQQATVGLPESETEEMHDAVMEVLYQGGVTRGNTYLLWQAYRKVLAATPQAQSAQRTWVGLMRGVRVEGDTVVITAKGGNDAARELCGALLEEKNT